MFSHYKFILLNGPTQSHEAMSQFLLLGANLGAPFVLYGEQIWAKRILLMSLSPSFMAVPIEVITNCVEVET